MSHDLIYACKAGAYKGFFYLLTLGAYRVSMLSVVILDVVAPVSLGVCFLCQTLKFFFFV